jgi:hypothetical protein
VARAAALVLAGDSERTHGRVDCMLGYVNK